MKYCDKINSFNIVRKIYNDYRDILFTERAFFGAECFSYLCLFIIKSEV
jgi:hypothetical protein